MNASGLGAELVEAFNDIFREAELTIDSVRRKKWVSGILRATYAIQHAFTLQPAMAIAPWALLRHDGRCRDV